MMEKYGSFDNFKKILSTGEKIYFEIAEAVEISSKGQAILLDDTFDYLDQEHRKIAFKLFKKSKLQVIMTARHKDELVRDANIIKLEMHGMKTYIKENNPKKSRKKGKL